MMSRIPGTRGTYAYSAIGGYLHGFAMQELSLPFTTPEQAAAMAVTFPGHFPATQYPHLAGLTTGHVLQPGYDYGSEFGFGLSLILDGLERAHTPVRKTARKPASGQPSRQPGTRPSQAGPPGQAPHTP